MLNCNEITKAYGKVSVLDGLGLDIKSPGIVGIVGESGSGKTTLLRIIAGLDQPDKGKVTWQDQVLVYGQQVMPPWQRPVGLVLQDNGLWPHLTVQEHFDFVAKYSQAKSKASDHIKGLAERFEIGSLLKRLPGELSGGQQKRVALVRTFITEPELLLLDEPFTGLDPRLRDLLCEYLTEDQRHRDNTVLIASHDFEATIFKAIDKFELKEGRLEPC